MGKAVFVTGLTELEKLEESCGKIKFAFAVPNASIKNNGTMLITSSNDKEGTAIVKGTSSFNIVCRLMPGEYAPAEMARVRSARL